MKRILRIILPLMIVAMAVIALLPRPARTTPPADSEMTAFLLERGFPEDYLADLIPQQLEDLCRLAYTKGARCLSISERPLPSGGSPASGPCLDVACLCTPKEIDGVTYIYEVFVYITYNWNEPPPVRKTDAIRVSWDSNTWAYDDSFTSKDFAYSVAQGEWITYKTWDRAASIKQNGLEIFTYIDLAESWLGTTVPAAGLRGSVTFALRPNPRDSMEAGPGTSFTNLYCNYLHDKTLFTSSLQPAATAWAQIGYTKH